MICVILEKLLNIRSLSRCLTVLGSLHQGFWKCFFWVGFALGSECITATDAKNSQRSRREHYRKCSLRNGRNKLFDKSKHPCERILSSRSLRILCARCGKNFQHCQKLQIQKRFPADERRFIRRLAQNHITTPHPYFLLPTYYLKPLHNNPYTPKHHQYSQ